ncbi:PadR family transcriptional regulator [Pseudactinotalea sp. Z1739]|uniref:PadR family transcriptional regulator n=1 Tax=Pseudactinotalea sp. Z1739 TaxID=3413028 RepID=UPI003C7B8D78
MKAEFETYLQELRRGTIVLACLHMLRDAGYGYGLLADLEDRGFATDANTLYPLLRRLEKQGYLTSEWDTAGARPRKFYRTSADGARLAEALGREWRTITGAIDSLAESQRTEAPRVEDRSTHTTPLEEER